MSFSNATSKTEREHVAFMLLEHVRKGDHAAVRNFFEEGFWSGGAAVQPLWHHLKVAVLNDDLAMARLLAAWDVTPPNTFELAQLRMETAEDFDRHLRFLHRCGIRFDTAQLETVNAAFDRVKEISPDGYFDVSHSLVDIPFEWWKALQAFHEKGAGETIIAGGALRDRYNKRPVRDVDIFLVSRGKTKANEKFIREVFKEAGLTLVPQMTRSGGYYTSDKYSDLPPPKISHREIVTVLSNYWSDAKRREAVFENWVVKAGLDKTEYNIVFMDPFYKGKDFASKVIKEFDIGLCQIGTDGRSVFYTAQYKSDVQTQTITTLVGGNHDHLKKVVAKYPDWKLSSLSRAVLGEIEEPVPGEMVAGQGVYLGRYIPKDRDGNSLSKMFNVFAAPEDLPETMKYVDAVKHIAKLKNWHGFDGTDYATDKEIYAALKDGSYNGGWIIPTQDILDGKDADGNATTSDNIFAHQNKGAFKDTFKSGYNYSTWYWSSTEYRSDQRSVRGVRILDAHDDGFYKDLGGPLSCRPVRLVEVRKP